MPDSRTIVIEDNAGSVSMMGCEGISGLWLRICFCDWRYIQTIRYCEQVKRIKYDEE